MQNSTQQEFLTDLQEFITQHPHYIQNDGIRAENKYQNKETITISDPDGDYEQITITISLIS